MTPIVPELPLITDAERARIIAAPRTSEAHRELLGDLPALNAVQTGGSSAREAITAPFTVVAWNVERGLFPRESAALLQPLNPQVVLLSEVDHGMARTGQRHTTEEIAEALGMTYAFAVEFFELDLGGETERSFCTDDFNARGWHGNAVLSSAPLRDVTLIRLDDHGHWYVPDCGTDPQQPRVGGRLVIAATIETYQGPICVVSTHLESNADAAHRAAQFDRLMDAVDAFAPDLPVVIGGDLNTGNHMPPDFDWRSETLFARAEARGYAWDNTAPGMTTRASLITPHPKRQMKLDWFATRGFEGQGCGILPALGSGERPLSDHEPVWCTLEPCPAK